MGHDRFLTRRQTRGDTKFARTLPREVRAGAAGGARLPPVPWIAHMHRALVGFIILWLIWAQGTLAAPSASRTRARDRRSVAKSRHVEVLRDAPATGSAPPEPRAFGILWMRHSSRRKRRTVSDNDDNDAKRLHQWYARVCFSSCASTEPNAVLGHVKARTLLLLKACKPQPNI